MLISKVGSGPPQGAQSHTIHFGVPDGINKTHVKTKDLFKCQEFMLEAILMRSTARNRSVN